MINSLTKYDFLIMSLKNDVSNTVSDDIEQKHVNKHCENLLLML